ncbi:hypothetical protein [Ensifer aridi]|uniref:COG4705 family protein n=1 Tax=Ensifer aridi TaxID=1708715 RepID=UPI00358E1196
MVQPDIPNKVAAITGSFWIAKIIATTLGETAGDFIAHTLGLGYVVGFFGTVALLVGVLLTQIRSNAFHPAVFWAAIVATTTTGTEISDMMDRTFGLGYVLGSTILVAGLTITLTLWYWRKQTLSVEPILAKDSELFFWIAVVFSNSLGTAFGDALIDPIGLNFIQGALVCSALIAVILVLHYFTKINTVLLFWAAFIFTRPFGATFGDFLVKEHTHGGLELGTLATSLVASALLAGVVFIGSRRERKMRLELSDAKAS